MSGDKTNGVATWKTLLPLLLAIVLALSGYIYAEGASNFTQKEFKQFEKRFESHTSLVIKRLEELKRDFNEELKGLRGEVDKIKKVRWDGREGRIG